MEKECYLSHWSAIKMYGSRYIHQIFKSELRDNTEEHYTVFSRKDLFFRKGCTIHLCSLPLPESHKQELRGKSVVSPELAFVQVASSLDIHRLILLALLLCAKPDGALLKPITSKSKMIRKIKNLEHFYGKKKALRALQYVENSCRSPMEAILFMLLRLPYNLGGYGLSGAIFDYEVPLGLENAKTFRQWRVFADLFYKKARLFIEYDSKEFHSNQADLQRDIERTAAILRENYRVIHVRTNQVFDMYKFETVAQNIARIIGKRIRIGNRDEFIKMQLKLRTLLPRFDDFPKPEKKWYA